MDQYWKTEKKQNRRQNSKSILRASLIVLEKGDRIFAFWQNKFFKNTNNLVE